MQFNSNRRCRQIGSLLLSSSHDRLGRARVNACSVRHELQQVLDLAVEVRAKLIDVLGSGVPAGLVKDARKGISGDSGLFRDLAHRDVAPLLEFALGDELFELESDHDWLVCTKAEIFAPGVDIVKFGLILGVNAPYMDHSGRKWERRAA